MKGDSVRGNPWITIGLITLIGFGFVGLILAVTGKKNRPDLEAEVVLICTNPECGRQFTMTIKELRNAKTTRPQRDEELPAVECPYCKKISAYRAKQCPNPKCGKYFLRSGPRLVCPHCGTDVLQYRKNHKGK